MVLDGLRRVRIVFPASDTIRPINQVVDAGRSQFTPDADQPVVAAMLTNDEPSVELVLGAIARGAVLVSLPLPGRAVAIDAYVGFLRQALTDSGATSVVARDDIAAMLRSAGIEATAHSERSTSAPVASSGPGFELIQYTSGSTGPPKPIRVDHHVLATNIAAILDRVRARSGDVTVSWLPLSHDMGLIGMLLASLAAADDTWTAGAEIILIEPEAFLRRPAIWMEAISHWHGTFTAAPDFGYRLAVTRHAGGDLNLATLRHAIIGGEVVRAPTLRTFDDTFRPAGLAASAFAPAYGMAELGLAATMTGPDETWRSTDLAPDEGAARTLVSSGRPLDGYTVDVDEDTARLTVVGPAAGYDAITGAPLAPGGRLLTGDTGFVTADGWVYVTGRLDDIIVVNGRNISALDIEAAVSTVPGVRPGRVAAVNLESGEWIVVAERQTAGSDDCGQASQRDVRQAAVAAVNAAPDDIALLPPGSLPMTSSGKLQRTEVRRRWQAGSLIEST
jgi:acyl-CoA synthetase (AMP-forming)/AMP-acid ligase II